VILINYLDDANIGLFSGEVIFAFLLPANNEELSSSLLLQLNF